ncbi:segregation/condensation protein A, partial [Klebsiella pneumoniae]|nr:segregation/condensation protein A [Klebsiella pneumoniae]
VTDAPQPGAELAPSDAGTDAAQQDSALAETEAKSGDGKFTVRLENFEGPFDLLLQLISAHELDVTEVALHKVTDEFIAYTRTFGEHW